MTKYTNFYLFILPKYYVIAFNVYNSLLIYQNKKR